MTIYPKNHIIWNHIPFGPAKVDHIAGKTIYPITIYPGRSVLSEHVLILNNLQCSSRPVLGKLPRWRASCPTLERQANFLPEGLELIWLPFFGVLSYSREEIVWHDSFCICRHGINLVSFRFFSSTFPSFAKDDEWMNFWRHQIKKSWLCWLEVGVRRGHLLLAKNEWRHGQWKGAKVSMLGALTKSCDM